VHEIGERVALPFSFVSEEDDVAPRMMAIEV
jgi:hypothetical protein